MNEPIWKKRADAMTNGDFIRLATYSGYRLALLDPAAKESLLLPEVSDDELGAAILEALSQSRQLSLEEARALSTQVDKHYAQTVGNLMMRYGYKTKEKLFRSMRDCGIEASDGLITIRPTNHEKLEGWSGSGIDQNEYVRVPMNSSPREVGAALRLAFSRCIG